MHRQYYKGECVFLQGETGNCAYIIEEGSIDIFMNADDGPKFISRLKGHAIFGEMSLMDDQCRSATAIAAEDTKLIVVSKEYFNEKLARTEPLVSLLAKSLLLSYREMRSRVDGVPQTRSIEGETLIDEKFRAQAEKDAASAIQQVKAENELMQAMALNQFELFYQPIVSLKDRRIVGCESLIRWRHPERGMIPPMSFIPRAEENGMIIPLGLWVIEEACHAYKRIKKATNVDFGYISVNLSRRQFEQNSLLESIKKIYEITNVDISKIRYEITESTMGKSEQTIHVLEYLRTLGSCIAIDDFGTGYSNFVLLHSFPIDTLKIDRSFISIMHESPKNYQIVNNLCALAKSLHMNVVAEGIETEEDHRVIQNMGIEYGQGYLYSRPLPEADFCRALLTNDKINS